MSDGGGQERKGGVEGLLAFLSKVGVLKLLKPGNYWVSCLAFLPAVISGLGLFSFLLASVLQNCSNCSHKADY